MTNKNRHKAKTKKTRTVDMSMTQASHLVDKNSRSMVKLCQLLEVQKNDVGNVDKDEVVSRRIQKLKLRLNRRLVKLAKWADTPERERYANSRPKPIYSTTYPTHPFMSQLQQYHLTGPNSDPRSATSTLAARATRMNGWPQTMTPNVSRGTMQDATASGPRVITDPTIKSHTGWVAGCSTCGKLGPYRDPSLGRHCEHKVFKKYCGLFNVNPCKILSASESAPAPGVNTPPVVDAEENSGGDKAVIGKNSTAPPTEQE